MADKKKTAKKRSSQVSERTTVPGSRPAVEALKESEEKYTLLVEADEGQIGQVVQNIVLNAEQAMTLGGGVEAARRLTEIDERVKAVVSSGYSDDEVVSTHRQHGFCSFLKKPYNLRELGRVLDDVLA